MRRMFFLLIALLFTQIFAYIPATADYVIFLKDFDILNSFLPPTSRLNDHTEGFVCFFGKMTLNLSSLIGLIETETPANVQNLLDVSIVTDDPEWVKKNFSALLDGHQIIQADGLYYFVSAMMLEDVKAMIKGQVSSIKPDENLTVYVKMQTVPIIGIVLHLLGLNEGVPVEDEMKVVFDSNIAKILVKSNKSSRSDWEAKRAQSQVLPKGLKILKDAQFSLMMPVSILSQIPAELLEEIGVDLSNFELIFSKAKNISLSFSQDMSKFAMFFDFKEDSIEELSEYFSELGAYIRRTEDFIYLYSDEFTGVLAVKGGISEILSKNVDEKDLVAVEDGVLGRISFKQDNLFADLSLYRENCSVILNLELSKDLISDLISEILSELLPKPEELNLLNEMIDSIDFRCYFMYLDPPENIEELKTIPEKFIDRITYQRKEEDDGWFITIGVKTDLADTLTEKDLMNMLSVTVDKIQIDRENKIIYIAKRYEKSQLPSAQNLITDFVNGIRQYYQDFQLVPEDLGQLLSWYVFYPEQVLDQIVYEPQSVGEKTTVKLTITIDEKVDESMVEELQLKDLFYEDGKLIVTFELP